MTAQRSERLQSPNDQKNPAHLRSQLGNAASRLRRVTRNLERAIFFQRDERDAT